MSHTGSTRRSASHGALRSSYDNHGGMDADNNFSLPPFRPLKSLRENTAFLQSPGPLESMLKTTTETGDIGIFSIRPIKSSSLLPREPRPRPSLKDARNVSRCSRSSSRTAGQDDRRRLPSYRDSTSEILSMYGGSTRSVSSSLYPGWEANGQRSYSMVSSASRYLPLSHAERPARGQQHPNGLQRPRSPFPYPTRLKRPGVRPASPALTENGSVDYSRMVEIDRISLRTVHGSYKPFPRQKPRRPLPLALRVDLNQSTPSTHPHPVQHRRQSPAASGLQGRSSHHGHSHGDQLIDERLENSAFYSRRLSSLTSSIDGYLTTPPQDLGPSTTSKKAFYYDYSEEFEGHEEKLPSSETPDAPLAPVPTRVSSSHQPMVLRDDYEDRLDSHDDGVHAGIANFLRAQALSESSQDASVHNPDDPSEPTKASGAAPARQVCSFADSLKPGLSSSPEGIVTRGNVPMISIASPRTSGLNLQGILSNDSGGDSIGNGIKRAGEQAGVSDRHKRAEKEERSDKLRLATSNGHSHFSDTTDESSPTSAAGCAIEQDGRTSVSIPRSRDFALVNLSRGGSRSAHRRGYVAGPSSRPGKHQHSRNQLAPGPFETRASVHGIEPATTPLNRPKSPMIAPEPISPARSLRVKESIPQLMKALPPLPGYSPAPESPFGAAVVPVNFEPFELSRLTEARSTLTDAILPESRIVGNTNNYHAFILDQNVEKKKPKLQVSPAATMGALREVEQSGFEESKSSPCDKRTAQITYRFDYAQRRTPIKARLKLKISRGALSTKSADDRGTVRRHATGEKSGAVSELESALPADLFTPTSGLETLYCSTFGKEEVRNEKVRKCSTTGQPTSSHTSAPKLPPIMFETHPGSSLDVYIDTSPLPLNSNDPVGVSEVRSVLSGESKVVPRTGLRRGLSNFRAMLAEARTHNAQQGTVRDRKSSDPEIRPAPDDANPTSLFAQEKGVLPESTINAKPNAQISVQTNKFKKKLGKWFRDARHALTAAVRKGDRKVR